VSYYQPFKAIVGHIALDVVNVKTVRLSKPVWRTLPHGGLLNVTFGAACSTFAERASVTL